MLSPWNKIRRRLDRVFVKLVDWRLHHIDMVGMQPIPGVTYNQRTRTHPVLPSDHFGLLVTLEHI